MTAKHSQSLRFAIYDGIAWSLMAGFGETFLSAFAIFLRANPSQLALLAAFPAFVPALSQMMGLWMLKHAPSRRTLISSAYFLQALCWVPIAFVGLGFVEDPRAPAFLLLFASVYFFFGGIGIPAWNSLIGDLVPRDSRGAYFGLRSRRMGYGTLLALILAGPLLTYFQTAGYPQRGFAVLFLIAAGCRAISAYWISRHEDPPVDFRQESYFSFGDFIRRTAYSNFTKFVFFVSLINLGLAICGPFFALYVLRELHFSYGQFTALSGCMIVAQILTLQHWGGLSDRFGNKAMLFIAAPGVTIAPLLWLISENFWWLVVLHLYSGFMWAGFNLAASNFLFDAVTPAKRARCAAYQSILNGFGILCGSLLGSYLLSHPFQTAHTLLGNESHKVDFYLLFVCSSMLRIVVVAYFWKLIKETREVESIPHKDLVFKVIQVKALTGLLFGFDSKPKKKTEERGGTSQ